MNFDAKQFIKDRHKAFSAVLYNDDLTELEKYCEKYGKVMPNKEWVAKAGILKAIQGCTDFTEEEKNLAMRKAIEIGANPFVKPYRYDEEEQ